VEIGRVQMKQVIHVGRDFKSIKIQWMLVD